jgi:S-adenosylhomocysteine hydrolase
MARMKDKAIVGNIGHFDNEIDMAGLKKAPGSSGSTSSRSTTSSSSRTATA